MNVINYLNGSCRNRTNPNDPIGVLEILKAEYGIKYSYNEEYELYCLNYDQINSAKYKAHPIVVECRSLVLDFSYSRGFEVVSRSFDRFFNLGEVAGKEANLDNLYCAEKLDGSLITFFSYGGEWLYRTKSMIMPSEDVSINGAGSSWKGLIENLVDMDVDLEDEYFSYIYELTSPENRVVTPYNKPEMTLLSIRNNFTGEYVDTTLVSRYAEKRGIARPKIYRFHSTEDLEGAIKELPDLEEGYVLYDIYRDYPAYKVKSPAYLAAHRLRGELIVTPKRIMDMIFINEYEEFLAVFPEYKEIFDKYITGMRLLRCDVEFAVGSLYHIENRKEFAMRVKDLPIAGMLFDWFSNKETWNFQNSFNKLSVTNKYKLLERYSSEY